MPTSDVHLVTLSIPNSPLCERGTAARDIIDPDMFMHRMCAITIDSETVQYRCSDCRRKISIRSASDLSFSQLIVDSSYKTRMFVKRHHSVSAFQWRTINSTAQDLPGHVNLFLNSWVANEDDHHTSNGDDAGANRQPKMLAARHHVGNSASVFGRHKVGHLPYCNYGCQGCHYPCNDIY